MSALSGDVWIADLIGSDDDTFLFSSKRHDQFRVNRSAVYMLERRVRPDFLFDGSQLKNWKLPKLDTIVWTKPDREAVDPAFPFDCCPAFQIGLQTPKVIRRHGSTKAEIFHAVQLA